MQLKHNSVALGYLMAMPIHWAQNVNQPLSHIVQAPERVDLGESFDVEIKFTNPLDEALTGGVLHIEAPGIVRSMVVPIK